MGEEGWFGVGEAEELMQVMVAEEVMASDVTAWKKRVRKGGEVRSVPEERLERT